MQVRAEELVTYDIISGGTFHNMEKIGGSAFQPLGTRMCLNCTVYPKSVSITRKCRPLAMQQGTACENWPSCKHLFSVQAFATWPIFNLMY